MYNTCSLRFYYLLLLFTMNHGVENDAVNIVGTYSSYLHSFYMKINGTYLIVFNKIWIIFIINVHHLQFPRFGTRHIGILYEHIISIEGEHWRLQLLWKSNGRLYYLIIICLWELGISLQVRCLPSL